MAIIKDIIDGTSASYSAVGWKDLTRTFIVTNLTSVDGHGKIYEAMLAVAASPYNIYIGSPHPTVTSAQVVSINPDAASSDVVRVHVSYDEVDNYPYQYSLSGVSSIVETNQYLDGTDYKDISLEYTFPSDYPIESFQNITKKTSSILNKYEPEFAVNIKRREYIALPEEGGGALTGAILVSRQGRYVGKCNQSDWTIMGSTSLIARSWLCTGITSEGVGPSSYTGGWIFDVTYSFAGKNTTTLNSVTKAGWDALVVFIDPNTGQPPDPTTLDSGSKKIVKIYEEADFNNLLLS